MPERIFTRAQMDWIGLPFSPNGDVEVHRSIEDDSGKWTRWMELVFRAPDDQRMWKVVYEEGLGVPGEQNPVDPWRGENEIKGVEVEPRIAWIPRADH
jgi:hypothetical protein